MAFFKTGSDPGNLLVVLQSRLRGAAAAYWQKNPTLFDSMDYALIKQVLTNRFKLQHHLAIQMTKFSVLQQDSKEAVHAYASRLKHEAYNIFGLSPSDMDKAITVVNFIKGLAPDIHKAVLSKNIADLDDCIQAAEVEDLNKEVENLPNSSGATPKRAQTATHAGDNPKTDSLIKMLMDKIQALELKIQEQGSQDRQCFEGRQPQGPPGPFQAPQKFLQDGPSIAVPARCFNCGRPGHM